MVELARRRFKPFLETLSGSGLTRLREGQPFKAAEYRQGLAKALGIQD